MTNINGFYITGVMMMPFFRVNSSFVKVALCLCVTFYGMNSFAVVANMNSPVEVTSDDNSNQSGSGSDTGSGVGGGNGDIASEVMGKINQDKDLRSLQLKAKVTGVEITLEGTVLKQHSVADAIAAARTVPGVVSVKSNLKVKMAG
jgi:osmotically-inducible protein OsmY